MTRLIADLAWLLTALLWASWFAAVHEAFGRMTPGRAGRLQAEAAKGADRVAAIAADPNVALATVRLLALVGDAALVLAAFDLTRPISSLAGRFAAAGAGAVVLGFVVAGVGARTLGRQHASAVAGRTAGFVRALTACFGPVTRLLILVGNAITPGRGFPEGPFATEDELRAY
ncbi:MAG: DUF21 domain-containing protein, partial [Propionibacteriaceae bacterium]|nr:DUF21 domain-containing protein [Propionibacteriaceae bacterium]